MYNKNKRAVEFQKGKEVIQDIKVIEILLDLTRTLEGQGLPLRGDIKEKGNFFQLLKLVARPSPTLKILLDEKYSRPFHVSYCSPESQSIFIEFFADEISKETTKRVRDTKLLSVFANTTPATSRQDRLSFAVRFVDSNLEAEERLMEVKELKDKTDKTLGQRFFANN